MAIQPPQDQQHGNLVLALTAMTVATTRYDWECQMSKVTDETRIGVLECGAVLANMFNNWAERESLPIRVKINSRG